MSGSSPPLAEIAAVVGNPARANILLALMDGGALTAKELAHAAGVSAQTTSGHLARLADARLLVAHRQGRHVYFRLTSPLVGRMLEGIMAVAGAATACHRPSWRGGETLRTARTCYDHLAGRLGVALTETLERSGHVVLTDDGGMVLPGGEAFLGQFGIDLAVIGRRRRVFCRPCLDWSERRPHLAGALGAALAERCFALGWIARLRDTRAVRILPAGESGLARIFGIDVTAWGRGDEARPSSQEDRSEVGTAV